MGYIISFRKFENGSKATSVEYKKDEVKGKASFALETEEGRYDIIKGRIKTKTLDDGKQTKIYLQTFLCEKSMKDNPEVLESLETIFLGDCGLYEVGYFNQLF